MGSIPTGRLGYDDTADRGGAAGGMASLNAINLGNGVTALAVVVSIHSCALTSAGGVKVCIPMARMGGIPEAALWPLPCGRRRCLTPLRR